MPTESEWAWVAGLFEGEGTIAFAATNSVQISVAMTDRDILERLDSLVPSPSGVLLKRDADGCHKAQFLWQLSAKHATVPFLTSILPWLGHRRGARARAALERLSRAVPHGEQHPTCRRGHLMVESNLLVMGGVRRCKTCRIASGHYTSKV